MSMTEIKTLDVSGHRLRVGTGRGAHPPLLLFDGIGANLELLEPVTDAMEGIETIVFDVPGVGGSTWARTRTPPTRAPGCSTTLTGNTVPWSTGSTCSWARTTSATQWSAPSPATRRKRVRDDLRKKTDREENALSNRLKQGSFGPAVTLEETLTNLVKGGYVLVAADA